MTPQERYEKLLAELRDEGEYPTETDVTASEWDDLVGGA